MELFDTNVEGEDIFSVFDGEKKNSASKKRKNDRNHSKQEVAQESSLKKRKDKESSTKLDEITPDSDNQNQTNQTKNHSSDSITTESSTNSNGSKPLSWDSRGTVAKGTSNNIRLENLTKIPGGGVNLDREVITCLHEICFPPNKESQYEEDDHIYDPVFPANPVRQYKFTLDPFQRKSVACLERGESVLVAAHTSAGKTVIAEYAIEMSLKRNQRVIYTSPIKALSNQKYREFEEQFKDVGLMTGDITINANASCLVMTTEILRSMLYRGSEIMREVAWVVFDEIHYMRDKERGVVWEETIILLPPKVRFVFLSATIPNASEFASWVAKIHDQPCHVVYTDVRPTPLQHYIFPAGGDGLHLVVDEKGVFREENFQKALSGLSPAAAAGTVDSATTKARKKTGKGTSSDIYKIVKLIMDRQYDPVIVFSFSKRDCEALAMQMAKLDFNKDTEKKMIENIFSSAIDSLSEEDRAIPQVNAILPLLKRGIGIHHSGLLPILKEVIEILFQEGLIKCLFATETFSMGLNMPAKTVVFTSLRKFDGESFRWITSGEYIQMSGRAGRRGLDDRGIVIMMVDEKMEPAVAKNMVKGLPDALYSSFYISYNMLLNLLRVEGIEPEYMLKKSFHQFQNDKNLPNIELKMKLIEDQKNAIVIKDENNTMEYAQILEQLEKLKEVMNATINEPVHSLPFIQPGRLVRVKEGTNDFGWGVIINYKKTSEKGYSGSKRGGDEILSQEVKYVIDVLLRCATESGNGKVETKNANVKPVPAGTDVGTMQVVPVTLSSMNGLSSIRLNLPKDLRSLESRQTVGKTLRDISKKFSDGIPVLDPIEDLKIEDESFKKAIRKVELLEDKILSNDTFKEKDMPERYKKYQEKRALEQEFRSLKKQIKQGESVVLVKELKSMKRVLRRLGYTTSEDIIETKGRVACEISAADELVVTELIFNGVFNELNVDQCIALLTCFIFEEKSKTQMKMKPELEGPYRKMQETAKRVAKVMEESKIEIDPEEAVQRLLPFMMEVAYQWALGAKFSEVIELTDIFEGSIIRCMRRLEELLRQLTAASKAIGNTELENKFSMGINKIKRDIIFAASLYL